MAYISQFALINCKANEKGIPTLDVKRYYQDNLHRLQDDNLNLSVKSEQYRAEQATWVFYCM